MRDIERYREAIVGSAEGLKNKEGVVVEGIRQGWVQRQALARRPRRGFSPASPPSLCPSLSLRPTLEAARITVWPSLDSLELWQRRKVAWSSCTKRGSNGSKPSPTFRLFFSLRRKPLLSPFCASRHDTSRANHLWGTSIQGQRIIRSERTGTIATGVTSVTSTFRED
jgi:hypothetical protein